MRTVEFAGLVFAAVSGLAIGWMDSRPGFDATGITVASLLIAAGASSFLVSMRSRPRLGLAALCAVLVGAWVPLFELGGPAGPAPLASLLFAAIGTAIGQTRRIFGQSV